MFLFWNIYALFYDLGLKIWFPYKRLIRDILDKLKVSDGDYILDAGCGTGYLILDILKQNKKVKIEGIDSSPQMIKYAKNKCRGFFNINLQLSDLNQRLNFRDVTFNKIVSCNVIYTLNNPNSVFKEFYRILKSEGMFVIANPKPDAQGKALFREQMSALKELSPFYRRFLYTFLFVLFSPINFAIMIMNKIIDKKAKKGEFHFLSRDEFEEKLRKVGFRNIQISSAYADQDILVVASK